MAENPIGDGWNLDDEFSRITRDQFIKQVTGPAHWLFCAQTLRRSGQILWDVYKKEFPTPVISFPKPLDRSMGAHAQGLLGLAIENLLKGLIVWNSPEIASSSRLVEDGEFPRELGIHNLQVLAKRAQVIAQSDSSTAYLDRISDCVIWMGRFVVPKNSAKMEDSEFRDEDFEKGLVFYRLVEAMVVQAAKLRWESPSPNELSS